MEGSIENISIDIHKLVRIECITLVEKVLADLEMSDKKTQFIDKYLPDNEFVKNISNSKKLLKKVKTKDTCIGTKNNGEPCTRKKKMGDFCGRHKEQSKNSIKVSIWEKNGNKYRVDDNNIIYGEKDDVVVGKRVDDDISDLSEDDLRELGLLGE